MERAIEWIDYALDSTDKEKPDGFVTLIRTCRGHALSVLGRRAQAEKEYRQALASPDFADFHAQARTCLERPCARADLLQNLNELAR